ncbi:aminodeoxychorismate/anthranilate synthase component II [bacterium]|nr:aminodeoxychorismate/anthranilate synthase component II [bacterium]
MLVMIDNYDSFTYNLVHYFLELGIAVDVVRNDELTLDDLGQKNMSHLVISPGPGRPADAGITEAAISHFAGKVPILGVCLGHQAIGEVFGGKVVHAPTLVHGKTSRIFHESKGIFQDIPNPFLATRYHSLVVDRDTLPADLEITAETEDGLIMGIRHRQLAIEGVQFHPESILSEYGRELLRHFVEGKR